MWDDGLRQPHEQACLVPPRGGELGHLDDHVVHHVAFAVDHSTGRLEQANGNVARSDLPTDDRPARSRPVDLAHACRRPSDGRCSSSGFDHSATRDHAASPTQHATASPTDDHPHDKLHSPRRGWRRRRGQLRRTE